MLDPCPQMAVALDAEPSQQANAERWNLAEVMAAAERDGEDAGL